MAKKLVLLVALIAIALVGRASAVGTYSAAHDGAARGVVLMVGDSNVTYGAAAIATALTTRQDGYVPVMSSRSGYGIRGFRCLTAACAADDARDYWKIRLANVLGRVTPDAIVIELGINDAHNAGDCASLGYACYGQKIDWLLSQIPSSTPVYWTNLACSIEPVELQIPCRSINFALASAPARHPNLTLLNWAGKALNRTAWIKPNDVHFNDTGFASWSALVASALDARFPDAG
jgi:lysophospholipase L1-like esterase